MSDPQDSAPFSDLQTRVDMLRWYHSIPLPGAIVTPGVQDSPRIVERLGLPSSFAGRSVLDIGAFDGFYSFYCAQRGADRVLATDCHAWLDPAWGRDGFPLARGALGLEDQVDEMVVDVMALSPEKVGNRFDIVLFLGVLYHLRDPITALERAASVCTELLVLETETALNWLPFGAGRVYVDDDLNNDASNWYAYNVPTLKRLLRRVGFSRVSVVYRTSVLRRLGRTARALVRRDPRPFTAFRSQRVIIHARP